MIPLHSNPYLLPQSLSTELTSRKSFFDRDFSAYSDHESQSDSENNYLQEQDRLRLVNILKDRIQTSLDFVVEAHRTGRAVEKHSHSESPLDFKLFSGSVKPIALESGPPPPPTHYREPDYEDNELQAKRRKTFADSVAVDYSWLIRESQKPHIPFPSGRPKLLNASASSDSVARFSPMMILRHDRAQHIRKPHSSASGGALTHHSTAERPSKEHLPLIEITLQSQRVTDGRKRRRRRRHGRIVR